MADTWYFLHIPKTAGTTFRVFLENCFQAESICPAYVFFDLKRHSREELRRFRLFRGHLGYNLVNYLEQRPNTLVMLRDPMERVVSHFEYIRRDPTNPRYPAIQEQGMDLGDYLAHPVYRAELTHSLVQPLAHTADRAVLETLLARSDSQDAFARAWRHTEGTLPPLDELLDKALERLEQMAFIGLAERLDEGLELAAWLMGGRPQPVVQSLNINPERIRLKELPERTRELLEEITVLDYKLYARARELFERRHRAMRHELLEAHYRRAFRRSAGNVTEGSFVLDFSSPLHGTGWHQRELLPGRGMFRWSGPGVCSDIDVPIDPGCTWEMRMTVIDWLDDAVVRGLRIEVSGQPVAATLHQAGEEIEVRARIDASLLSGGQPFTRISFRLPHTAPLPADRAEVLGHSRARRVGIAVIRFEFIPLGGGRPVAAP